MLTKCKICTAKTAGFCFGVDRAVKIVYNELDNRNNVVTLGPIIHNKMSCRILRQGAADR